MPFETSLGENQNQIKAALAGLKKTHVIKRIWEKDYTVWKPEPVEITNRLGWLTVTDVMRAQIPELLSFAGEVRDAGFTYIVLLGMGGSSLGAEVFKQTFGNEAGFPQLLVLDSTVPAAVQSVTDAIYPPRTLFLVSSKSGSTTEPMMLYRYFRRIVEQTQGKEAGRNFAAITDAGTSLVKLAEQDGFRKVFVNPSDIGGRYSVLSFYGLVPAALIGVDIQGLLERADGMKAGCSPSVPAEDNPGSWLGAYIGALAANGRDKLTIVTSPGVSSFGLWAEQLIAESTGKEGKGIIPVAGEPLLSPEYYGEDRLFVYLHLNNDDNAEIDPGINAIKSSEQPVVVLEIKDKLDLGAEFYRWEFATAVAGSILGINPFNQPNVQQAKDATQKIISEYVESKTAPRMVTTGSVETLLADVTPKKYFSILAYLNQTPELDAAVMVLRRRIMECYHMTTTVGYGPRYLHSTGQLHKGGPNSGLFLLITEKHKQDIAIPCESFTFGIVADAQASGDLKALQAAGRKVVSIHFPEGITAGLQELPD